MTLLSLKNITHRFNEKTIILKDVNLELQEKQIVSLLGRSGSGKSTLLRIIAGLIKPSEGDVTYDGKPLEGISQDISMVFQTFALFPWLDIEQNIAIGLEAKGIAKDQIKIRSRQIMEIIGLQGYESAYPKELSGGMRQRVGFARALALNPKILLMDEPFSALDILTAHNLRTDFLDLWQDKNVSLNSVLLVTHNIEEAVFLSDKIKIFSSNPGSIIAEIDVNLSHPRDRLDPNFRKLVEDIYLMMTSKLTKLNGSVVSELLPLTKFSASMNFVDTLHSNPYFGKANIAELPESLHLEMGHFLEIVDSLTMIKFIDTSQTTISLTASGRIFAEGETKVRKQILAEHLIQYVPIFGHIRRLLSESILQNKTEAEIRKSIIETYHISNIDKALDHIVSWARYANLFYYDDLKKIFYMTCK